MPIASCAYPPAIGGKNRNRHRSKRCDGTGGGEGSGTTPIAGAVSRKGNVVARVTDDVTTRTLATFVRETVSTEVSLLCTDAYAAYRHMHKLYPHGVINHEFGQYVVRAIHTNTIEGFWPLMKHGMVGTFHKVSRKYLPLYVAEFQFRYNHRNNPDTFDVAVAGGRPLKHIDWRALQAPAKDASGPEQLELPF